VEFFWVIFDVDLVEFFWVIFDVDLVEFFWVIFDVDLVPRKTPVINKTAHNCF
jgi:hypothetical protein